MNRCAVFVDAGYLFAAGSQAVFGAKRQRQDLRLDVPRCIAALRALQQARTSSPLLRIYWYDGVRGGPSPEHHTIGLQDDVKLRLGSVNSAGQQKGVDSLIVTDMIALARNGAIADAVLIAGDEDLRIGVSQAQELGVRVHLVGVMPATKNQSGALREEADTRSELGATDILPWLLEASPVVPAVLASSLVPASVTGPGAVLKVCTPSGVPAAGAEGPAERLALELNGPERAAVVDSWHLGNGIPQVFDKQLLRNAGQMAARPLGPDEKREIRERFVSTCRVLGEAVGRA